MAKPITRLAAPEPPPLKTGAGKAALIALPMFLITALFILHGKQLSNPEKLLPAMITYLFANTTFFLMIYTGQTHKYRSRFFVTASILFVVGFLANLLEVRGTMELSAANMLDGETPFCPLVIPMILIPAAFTNTVIFPGSFFSSHGIAPILVMWLGFSLAVGRGWCGWICFFGGMDEGFSHLCRKPKPTAIPGKWTFLPWAVLLVIVLTSAIAFTPTYCSWLCPFKLVTEYPAVNSAKTAIQAVIFATLFAGLVVVLPILTGRRTQCGLFCPFGAFQSLTNKVNLFEVRINRERCVHCKLCVNNCPTFCLDEDSLQTGKPRLTCTKCGKCVDICPKRAVHFHLKGTPLALHTTAAKILFIYPAFLFAAAVGGSCIYSGLERIFRLLFTGSMLH